MSRYDIVIVGAGHDGACLRHCAPTGRLRRNDRAGRRGNRSAVQRADLVQRISGRGQVIRMYSDSTECILVKSVRSQAPDYRPLGGGTIRPSSAAIPPEAVSPSFILKSGAVIAHDCVNTCGTMFRDASSSRLARLSSRRSSQNPTIPLKNL